METCTTVVESKAEQEKPLFLNVVVIGFLLAFDVGLQRGIWHSILRLFYGGVFGAINLSLVLLVNEIFRRFSSVIRNETLFPIGLASDVGVPWSPVYAGISMPDS